MLDLFAAWLGVILRWLGAGVAVVDNGREPLACRFCRIKDLSRQLEDTRSRVRPYSIGSRHCPGLSKLAEEAGEVVQVVGKIVGLGGMGDHWDGTNLRLRLQEEIADVLAAASFIASANQLDDAFIQERVQEKLRRFRRWHELGDPVVP